MSWFNWLLWKLLVSTVESLVPAFPAIPHRSPESIQPSTRVCPGQPWRCGRSQLTGSLRSPREPSSDTQGPAPGNVMPRVLVCVTVKPWASNTSIDNWPLREPFKSQVRGVEMERTKKVRKWPLLQGQREQVRATGRATQSWARHRGGVLPGGRTTLAKEGGKEPRWSWFLVLHFFPRSWYF